MLNYMRKAILSVFMVLFISNIAFAADCFIKKNCFGVIQPYLITNVCYLFDHESKIPPEAAQAGGAIGSAELSVDQLHVAFVKLAAEKKFIVLNKGTPISNCGFDLNVAQNDPDMAKLMGSGTFPEFNCKGATFSMIPVKPNNQDLCYWVAVANLECRFYPLTKRHLTDDEYE